MRLQLTYSWSILINWIDWYQRVVVWCLNYLFLVQAMLFFAFVDRLLLWLDYYLLCFVCYQIGKRCSMFTNQW